MWFSSRLFSSVLLLSPHFVSALPHIRPYVAIVRSIGDIPAEARSYADPFIDSEHGDIEPRDATPTVTLTKVVWVKAFLEDTPTGVAVIPGNPAAYGQADNGNPNGQQTSTSEASAMTSSAPFTNSSTPTGGNSTTARTPVPFLRGVNLGGWLILEKWMNWDAFTGAFADATDEWTFSQIPGAADALHAHWESYFTEADIQAIAATGINALRIPIGYWAYDNSNSPYIIGADVYLERVIGWARNAGLKVWVDCHGSQGSQNGFDSSGHAGEVNWQQQTNLDQSVNILKTMAAKYGAMEFADVVVGLEMVNEPTSWGNNNIDVTKSWAKEAFAIVKAAAANPDLVIVMHDAFQGALSWTDVAQDLNDKQFGMDSHVYQVFVDADNAMNQDQHIAKVCDWAGDLGEANKIMPVYVGEWSAATNICVNPDGSTTPGTNCSVDGCQCQSTDFASWNDGMIQQVRKFVEAQLDVFESSTSGYFLWSAKGPGGWGFLNGIGNGAIPNPVTSRKYQRQCGMT